MIHFHLRWGSCCSIEWPERKWRLIFLHLLSQSMKIWVVLVLLWIISTMFLMTCSSTRNYAEFSRRRPRSTLVGATTWSCVEDWLFTKKAINMVPVKTFTGVVFVKWLKENEGEGGGDVDATTSVDGQENVASSAPAGTTRQTRKEVDLILKNALFHDEDVRKWWRCR